MNREDVQAIINQQAEAARQLRQASAAFDNAVIGLRVTLDAVAAANHAQGHAMDAVIAAHEAALRLLQEGK
jgi:hypothetical protein